MSSVSTPEAEPREKKNPAEQEASKGGKMQEKGGDDGAATPISPTQKKRFIDEYLQEQQALKGKSEASEDDVNATIWNTSQDAVRGPLQKLFKVGLFAANPIVYASVWGADALLQKVPLVNRVYGVPRNIVRGTAASVRDVLVAGATAPAIIPDVGLNIYEGMSKRVTKTHARGIIGRTVEVISETIGKILKKIAEITPKVVEGGKKTATVVGKVVTAPFKGIAALEGGIDSVTKQIPLVKHLGPLTHVISTAAALGIINWGATSILPSISPTAAIGYQNFVTWLTSLIAGG